MFVPPSLFILFKTHTNDVKDINQPLPKQIFFLVVVMINLMPGVLAVSPFTTLFPVFFVLTVSAVRELIEDVRRRLADRAANRELFDVAQDGGAFAPVRCEDIRVGDVVRLRAGQRVPADVVLLATSAPDGVCAVQTAQLDGETSLKAFRACALTAPLAPARLAALDAHILAERPSPNMHHFQGKIVLGCHGGEGEGINNRSSARCKCAAVDEGNVLLQGAVVRNTECAYGAVLYTGAFTKLARNQSSPPSKFSRADRMLNRLIFALMGLIAVMVALAGALSAFYLSRVRSHWYLWADGVNDGNGNSSTDTRGQNPTLRATLAYFVVTSYFVPMSIAITLEIVRLVQAFLIGADAHMTHRTGPDGSERAGALARTSSLNDDLSLVRYVFSDKTGTLTQNVMRFHSCFVNGVLYDRPLSGQLAAVAAVEGADSEDNDWNARCMHEFLVCMAVCNSVEPEEHEDGTVAFLAQSPDEEALCDAARANGCCLTARTANAVTVRDGTGHEHTYEVLATMPFSSERRRMSVLVRRPDGTAVLYIKGADNVVLPRLSTGNNSGDAAQVAAAQEAAASCAARGLRVLVLASREVPAGMLAQWQAEHARASRAIGERRERVAAVFDALERDLRLLGCTAVEDRLQTGVPAAVAALLRAGVQVWMITGDKRETAVNIARACRLVSRDALLTVLGSDITEENCDERLQEALNEVSSGCHQEQEQGEHQEQAHQDRALVLTGSAATHIMGSTNGAEHEAKLKARASAFMQVASRVDSVVCCETTPRQKAEIVQCVRGATGAVCVAVGDGANDVTMIQTADVGVGVYGREGTQAARSADYAVQQFRDLVPLLTVHGRYSMVRTALCVKYSFYKNVAFIMVQYGYGLFCLFSGRTVYDDVVVMLFNTLLSSLPPLAIGVFEQDVPPRLLRRYPELYRRLQRAPHLRARDVLAWLLLGFYQVAVFLALHAAVLAPWAGASGLPAPRSVALGTLSAWATCAALASLLAVAALAVRHWVLWTHAAIVLSALGFLVQWAATSARQRPRRHLRPHPPHPALLPHPPRRPRPRPRPARRPPRRPRPLLPQRNPNLQRVRFQVFQGVHKRFFIFIRLFPQQSSSLIMSVCSFIHECIHS